MSKKAFETNELAIGHHGKPVVTGIDIDIAEGGVTALVGPNGSGKSTLLRTLARLADPIQGSVILDGADIRTQPTVDVARKIAVLPQNPLAPESLTVGELVEQGRYPHVGALRMLRQRDYEEVETALKLTDMQKFASRLVDSLSGGERQRAWIALTLAQGSPILLLDEPTTFLDIGHQLEVLELVKTLNTDHQITVVMVLHDLNQAAKYSHRMVVLADGKIYDDGPPEEVMNPTMLAEVFNVEAVVSNIGDTDAKFCVPIRPL